MQHPEISSHPGQLAPVVACAETDATPPVPSRTSTRARVRTLAAVVRAKPMNQNCEASAPRKPGPQRGAPGCESSPSRACRSKSAEPDQEDRGLQAQAPDERRGGPHHRRSPASRDRIAPRNPIAARAKKAPEARPKRTGSCRRPSRLGAGLHGHDQHARASRPTIASGHGRRQVVAQKQQAEQRHLHRLGLGIGASRPRRSARASPTSIRRGRQDLRDGAAVQDIGQEAGRIGSGHSLADGKPASPARASSAKGKP